ncbi:DUF808 domain-containing protein [Rothia sp. P5764]|uniref:DUF808 domain-containing protein n=1 Tax=Rothia sp. P5764 TaxID=3402654 RepID=UPI003ABEFAEE
MAGGLAALLDDVAALAKLAAASTDDIVAATGRASIKAAGVVVDDAAVTPQYVQGVEPKRELPIIRKIAVGSLRNKLIFILPAALVLSQYLPWTLTPLLMIGGTYLCFEGAEKVIELLSPKEDVEVEAPVLLAGPEAEKKVVSGAVRTDFILSAEIMVIALNEVASEGFWSRAIILAIVGVAITVAVYGAVGLLVKMDDIGLHMAQSKSAGAQKFGLGLVKAMPVLMNIISIVGTFAMLWVGGHIILVGLDELGWHAPYGFVHHLEHYGTLVPALSGALTWCINTFCSMVLGTIWGGFIALVMHFLPIGKKHH